MDKFIETYGERPDGHGGLPTMTTRAQDTWDALRAAYELGRGKHDDEAEMADVGQDLMEAIRVHAYPSWSPAQCPSEIVGDLRNECDELRAKLAGASKVVAMLVAVARSAWNVADNTMEFNGEYSVMESCVNELSDALDALDELPDDQPGYVMNGPARAEWALRNLLCSAT